VITGGDCSPLEEEISTLKREQTFQKMAYKSLEIQAFGEAPGWPEEPLPGHAPEAFERVLQDAIESCEMDIDVVGMECDEPPCLAVVRDGVGSWYSDLTNCPAWADVYGASGTSSTSTVTCPDGREVAFAMVGPGNGDYHAEQKEVDPWAGLKRLQYRGEQVKLDYACDAE